MNPRARLRRKLLVMPIGASLATTLAAPARAVEAAATDALEPRFAAVRPNQPLSFPRDHGAHPLFRTEWWYVTGWLQRPDAPDCGFQITFFRSRTAHSPANPSRFAPTQLLFAHGALALPETGALRHVQRAARTGFGLAAFSDEDTAIRIGDWSLTRTADDRYRGALSGSGLSLDLLMHAPREPVLQGDAGFSSKGPRPEQASYYYSRPQLRVEGSIALDGASVPVTGRAWLDHEWSSTLLDERAVGWDWIGINLDDGGSLMAFRIRAQDGAVLWSELAWRDSAGRLRHAPQAEPRFEPLRWWRSARSGGRYPVEALVHATVDGRSRRLRLQALIDDQEIDARASTGGHYWEGAVTALDAASGARIGRGYYELTGYATPLRL